MSKTDFGIITTCYSGDFNLTRGLLASINYFEPEVPICIIQDGDFSIEKEKQTYNITHVIQKKDVKNEFLRVNCFGSRCTNMIAFWESPFEKYLYLDSDIVLWGKIDRNMLSKNDFHHNLPHEEYSEFIYKTQYCDFDRLFNFVPAIDYKNYNLFNAGVFAVKRGVFEIEQFKTLYELWKEDKSLMPAEPQGMINYLVYFLVENKNLIVSQSELQTVVPVFKNFELKNKIKFKNKKPYINSPTIIHWAGTKPLLIHRKDTFIKPMLFFRKEHLKNINSTWRFIPIPYLYWEEFDIILKRYYQGSLMRYLKSKIMRIIGR